MSVNSALFQFSSSHSSTMVWEKPQISKQAEEALRNGSLQKLDCIKVKEYDWYEAWSVKESETVNDDGTITKSMSGGVYVLSVGLDKYGNAGSGRAEFEVSLTFDPSTYEGGQLSAAADLLAAAHEASRAASRSTFSDTHLEQKSLEVEELYAERKEEAAKSFADMVGTPLEEQGRAGEWDKIYKSVHAVFASFEAKYQTVTESVDKDSWMDADLWSAAVKLQKIGMSFQMESGRAKGLYSLRELEYAALGVRSGLNLRT